MQGPTVVIADDERHITLVLQRAFERAGFHVITAQDGEEAFEVALTRSPSIIVSDFQMPGWGGIDLARALRERDETRRVPIIMLTARGHMISEETRQATNIVHLLSKPFSAKDVVRLAAETLGLRTGEEGAGPVTGAAA